MSLKINEITSSGDKPFQNFPVASKQVEVASVEEKKEEEKGFYERNKKVLWALGAIGAAGIAIVVHKHFKIKNMKGDINPKSDDITDAVTSSARGTESPKGGAELPKGEVDPPKGHIEPPKGVDESSSVITEPPKTTAEAQSVSLQTSKTTVESSTVAVDPLKHIDEPSVISTETNKTASEIVDDVVSDPFLKRFIGLEGDEKLRAMKSSIMGNSNNLSSENLSRFIDELVAFQSGDANLTASVIGTHKLLIDNVLRYNDGLERVLFDKYLEVLPSLSNDARVNIVAEFLMSSDKVKNPKIFTSLSPEYFKKYAEILSDTPSTNVTNWFHTGKALYSNFSVANTRMACWQKYFNSFSDINKLEQEMKAVFASGKVLDNEKLGLLGFIQHTKGLTNINDSNYKFARYVFEEILNTNVEEYSFSYTTNNVFEDLCKSSHNRIENLMYTYLRFRDARKSSLGKVFPYTEDVSLVSKMKKVFEQQGANSSIINRCSCYELEARCCAFDYRVKQGENLSETDLEKFVDEMLVSFKDACDTYTRVGGSPEDLKAINTRFRIFRLSFFDYCINMKPNKTKEFAMDDKICDFSEKVFGVKYKKKSESSSWNYGGYNSGRNHGRSSSCSGRGILSEAKNIVIKHLEPLEDSGDDVIKEMLETLRTGKLDAKNLKNIKRKLAMFYHPDKATPDKKAEHQSIFQELMNQFEILESNV